MLGLSATIACTKSDMSVPANAPTLYVPTAFTPNGDGVNDYFIVVSSAPLSYYNITIYDNNNIAVYQGNDIKKGWDGKFQGAPEPVGSYLWVINYQAEGTAVARMSGWVELIR